MLEQQFTTVRKYTSQHIESHLNMMRRYGFDHVVINPDGRLVLKMVLEYHYFDVTVSYIPYEDSLLIWIDDNRNDLYSGCFPFGRCESDSEFRGFVSNLIRQNI